MRMLQFSETGKKVPIFLIAGALVLGAAACSDDSTGVELSSVRILLTDAPTAVIASAEVWISRVYLQGGADGGTEGAGMDLFNDPDNPQHYDLLILQNGVTVDLTGAVDVGVGIYRSLLLVVDRAEVTLADGLLFEDGTNSTTLFVPSGSSSGVKVLLVHDLELLAGETTTLTVDFDVAQNFVLQGNDGSGSVRGINFTPLLRELTRNHS